MQLLEYVTNDGVSSFSQWFEELNVPAALKVRRALAQLEAANWSNTKSVGGGVREQVINFGPGYRVYFSLEANKTVVLLGGGTKKRQQKDIDLAKERWRNYKLRRRRGT